MSEFIDTFVKFSNFMSQEWAFESLFCPKGMVFVHNDCPRGMVFVRFKSCPRGGGMVMDEIDTCIKFCDTFCSPYPIVRIFNHQNRELYFLENLESLFK